jgi:multidrug efflux pump subunit AcrA (membrane-fusion protein)
MANRNISAGNAQVDTQLKLQQILIDQAQTTYDQLDADAADAEFLYGAGAISRNEYDAALKSRANAKSALNAAVAQIDVINAARLSQSGLRGVMTYTGYYESMKRSLNEQIAVVENQIGEDYSASTRRYYDAMIAGEQTQINTLNKNIADCAIASPVSGKITKLYIKDSNIINAVMPIAQIETERTGEIEVYVTTRDFTDVRLQDAVEITQPASSGDIVFRGVVTEIGGEAETRMSTLGINEYVVKITITPDAGARVTMMPGFAFDVKFFTYTAENQIAVPKTAVFKYSADRAAGGVGWLENGGSSSGGGGGNNGGNGGAAGDGSSNVNGGAAGDGSSNGSGGSGGGDMTGRDRKSVV